MELSINILGQGPSQRDENFRKWKAESCPPDLHVPIDTESKKMMDEELYTYAKEDRFDELFRDLKRVSSAELSSIIYRLVGPSGNSLLHVAASHESKNVTELLLHHFPPLITTKNFQGDTALHLAARGGQPRTTSILVNEAKSHGGETDFVTFMEMRNDRGNTALHDAVINGHRDVANFLVSEHSKLSYMENNELKSPLYLAVETTTDNQSDEKMLATLMHAIPHEVDLLKMLKGKSPVHAAVQTKKKNIVKQIANKKPELLRVKDETEANALHCAASMGYVWATQFLFDEYRDGAIEKNGEGNLPIHVASIKGHVDVVEEYISKWTDPTEFLNRKGQNILHVAAESERQFGMVKYILNNDKLHALLNGKDRDGNTPLHLASKYGRSIATFNLVRNKMVKKDIANGDSLTPYQVVKEQSKAAEAEFSGEPILNGKDNQVDRKSDNNAGKKRTKDKLDNHGLDNQVDQKNDKDGGKQQPKSKLDYYGVMMTLSILHFFADPKGSEVEYFSIQSKPPSKEEIKSRIENLLVVAVLVAGVTFSGAIQLPQLRSIDSSSEHLHDSNSTASYNSTAFDSPTASALLDGYLCLDVWALNTSVVAAIILLWTNLNDFKFAPFAVWFSSLMVGGSIYMMCLAFFFAVTIALGGSNYGVFAIILIVVGALFFVVQTLLYIQWILPRSVNQILEVMLSHCVHYLFFLLFYCSEWLPDKLSELGRKQKLLFRFIFK